MIRRYLSLLRIRLASANVGARRAEFDPLMSLPPRLGGDVSHGLRGFMARPDDGPSQPNVNGCLYLSIRVEDRKRPSCHQLLVVVFDLTSTILNSPILECGF